MYALVKNGIVVKTFAAVPEFLENFSGFQLLSTAEKEAVGFFEVTDNRSPLPTAWHYYTDDVYTVSGNQVLWTATVNERAKTPDEQDAEAAKAYPKLLALKNMTPAQIQSWVDANVNSAADLKDAIKTLAVAVGVLARRL